MVENLPSSAGDVGSIPGWGTKIPHATKPTHSNKDPEQPKKEKFYSASWSVNNREPTRTGISGHLQCPTWENGWLVCWFTADTYSHPIATL